MAAGSVIAVIACAPGAAQAAYSLDALDVSPSTTQAGGHPSLTVDADLSGGRTSEVVLTLPPGLVGNPTATSAVCTIAQWEDGRDCPAASRVGTSSASAIALGLPFAGASGDVYNLEPRGDEPARLGLAMTATFIGLPLEPMPLEAPITVRSSDAALVTTIKGIPKTATALKLPIDLTGLTMTLNGTAPSGRPFLTNPTTCAPATSAMTVTAWDGGGTATKTDTFTPTGCDAVPFTPGMGVTMESTVARTPTGATVTLDVPAEESPVRQSTVRRARVVLPEGVAMNAPLGGGLEGCADDALPACPAASDVGDARVETALVGALTGDVFLGTPAPGDPYRLFVVLTRPGLQLVMRGSVAIDPATGRITTTFDDLPQVPFTRFALTFRGGDRAVLLQSDRCGEQVASATLTPWSGGADASATASYATTDCAGALTPGFSAAPSTTQAGASPALAMTVERPDRQPALRDLSFTMPAGLLGRLASVPFGAQVGSVDVLAGAGGSPLALTGTITLVEPAGDELAALLVRVPAKVGPFDLGTVELRSGMRLRSDGRLSVTARDLPASVGGIPLEMRRMVLRLDREGFLVNPTACGTAAVDASINGVDVSAPYPVTGCGALPFSPRLSATIAGGRSAARKGGRPSLTTTITQAEGQAAIRSAAVTLPPSLTANIAAVGAACKAPDPEACPASATVGSAEAVTPLLAAPLRGKVVLMASPDGGLLPRLAVLLRGQIPLRLDAAIGFDDERRTVATFGALPDVPVTRFRMTLDGGPNGLESAASDLCTAAQAFTGAFVSWAGTKASAGASAAVDGCGRTPAIRMSVGRVGRRGPAVVVRVTRAAGGPSLRGLSVVLPESLRARSRPLARIDGARRGSRRGVLVRNGVATIRRAATRSLELRFPAGSLRPLGSLRTALGKGSRPALRFTVDAQTADGDTWSFIRETRARR